MHIPIKHRKCPMHSSKYVNSHFCSIFQFIFISTLIWKERIGLLTPCYCWKQRYCYMRNLLYFQGASKIYKEYIFFHPTETSYDVSMC